METASSNLLETFQKIKRLIVQYIAGNACEISTAILDLNLEQIWHQSMKTGQESSAEIGMGLEPRLMESIFTQLIEFKQSCDVQGRPAILIVVPQLRITLEKIFMNALLDLHILLHQEISDNKQVHVIQAIRQKAGVMA